MLSSARPDTTPNVLPFPGCVCHPQIAPNSTHLLNCPLRLCAVRSRHQPPCPSTSSPSHRSHCYNRYTASHNHHSWPPNPGINTFPQSIKGRERCTGSLQPHFGVNPYLQSIKGGKYPNRSRQSCHGVDKSADLLSSINKSSDPSCDLDRRDLSRYNTDVSDWYGGGGCGAAAVDWDRQIEHPAPAGDTHLLPGPRPPWDYTRTLKASQGKSWTPVLFGSIGKWIPILHSNHSTHRRTKDVPLSQGNLRSIPLIYILYTSIFILTLCLHTVSSSMMCPTPEPCHCIGNDIIYCAFKRLTKLPYFLDFFEVWDQLNLSDNLLNNLPADGFTGIKVRTMDLTRNVISRLDVDSFTGIEYLYVLDLSHNHMSHIPKMLLAPLHQLKTLKLRYNRFRSINGDAFVKVPHLLELDLSGNDLTSVPSEALKSLIHLKSLWLRNNKLQTIGAYAFPEIPLELLDLGENDAPVRMAASALCGLRPKIAHAEPNVKEWTGIHTLLMDHNGLSHLDPCVTKLLWTLQKVQIGGNALRCDCRLYLLKVWGIRTTFPHAQCAAPFKMASEYVDNLDKHKFNCSRSDTVRRCEAMCPPPTPPPNVAPFSPLSLHPVLLIAISWLAMSW